ncbi:MAG: LLM class flavin-dependent oxidoreductase [Betaproteobacteria bacterium]|nr:LLM class flavin-dependent oxidoreductase [Betaproteobacteria bacterium]
MSHELNKTPGGADFGPGLAQRIAFRKPPPADSTMRFGIFWPYSDTFQPSTLLVERNPDVMDIGNHLALARATEEAGFDVILIADGFTTLSDRAVDIHFQDPSTNAVTLAPPLIMATSRIGIVSTIHTTYMHPVQIARYGAQLDALSGGRWGWNIVAGHRMKEALLFGFNDLPGHDLRYEMADECVRLIREIWESPKGVDHQGKHFTVKGRLRGPYPQGRPLLVSAASSGRGHDFAIEHCDYLFATVASALGIVEIRKDLEQRAADAKKAMPPLLTTAIVLVRDAPGEAEREYAEIMDSVDAEVFGMLGESRSTIIQGGKMADFPIFLGTAEQVAQQIIDLHRETGLTGLMFRLPYWTPEEVSRLKPVFARLEQAGVWIDPANRNYSW